MVDFVRGKPNTQDLADIVLEQLPEGDTKESFYRLTEKLKEIFDFYDNGNLVGPQGARGPMGPAGPPGSTIGIEGPPGPPGESTLERDFIADASIQVNTPVFLAGNNYVQGVADNNPTEPIIGVVTARPDGATATVRLYGFWSMNLPRGELWLSEIGTISTVRPSVGHMQRLGMSFGDGQILIRPEQERVLYVV
jgi:hypothetical protein